jgi:NADH-quinone oxidoreductase subunit M
MTHDLRLVVLTFFPALGAIALMVLRCDDHAWIKRMALVVSVSEFIFSLGLVTPQAHIGQPGYALEVNVPWIASPPIHFHMGVDGLSVFLIILTTLLTPISILASWNSINHRVKEFFVMLLVLEVGVVGVFLSLDMFLFFLFWEIMLIPMAFLIGIWGHERRVYAAVKFILYTMAGSILMLVGILWSYNRTDSFDLATIQRAPIGFFGLVLNRNAVVPGLLHSLRHQGPLFPLHTGCPTLTSKLPPPAPSSWPGCSSKWALTA